MGGLVTRYLPLLDKDGEIKKYKTTDTFGRGIVHKLITLDTPHLGSPISTQLLNSTNECTKAWMLAYHHNPTFQTVKVNGVWYGGAIGDTSGGWINRKVILNSDALIAINKGTPLPIATIAAVTNSDNKAGLDGPSSASNFMRAGCPNDPLAKNLKSDLWDQNIYGGEPNDASVPVRSALNTIDNPTSDSYLSGYIHNDATEELGFNGPGVTDGILQDNMGLPNIPKKVIDLLNTPVNDNKYIKTNPKL
jgi:hypothetical protein